MRKLIAQFVKYPFYANIIIIVLVVGGAIGLASMKKSFFPDFSTRNIFVSVVYPGASPKEMEEGVTIRIEEAIRGIAGIKEVTSTSSENFANVQIETTGKYDLDETLMEVKNAVDGISSFPVDAERPIVFKQRAASFAMFMGLSGNVDMITLKNYANKIENDLYASGVMSQITVQGYPALEIAVEASEENLRRYNISFNEIALAISMNNRDISAGMIKSKEEEVLILIRSRSVKPEDIGNIILRANNDGSHLRIRDVAMVKLQFADVASASLMNGKKSVSFSINKLPDEDLEAISDFCHEYVNEFNKKNPEVQLHITYDFLEMLGGRLNLLYRNGGIGLLLIFISLGLFLSLRVSVWVAIGIPLSFLAMFIVAASYGITINMISLFGMILVVGILVDDGIVIAENIYSHFESGKSPARAAVDGTMEVLPAVLTAVTTTIIAFVPFFLLEGRMEFMFEMAFVVAFSLGFSLFEAFFVLPGHIGNAYVLNRKKRTSFSARLRHKLDRWLDWMRKRIYGVILRKLTNWVWPASVIPLALVIITVGLIGGGFIKTTFFPVIPFDQFTINITFKPGSGEQKTLDYLKKFDKAIWDVNKELMEELNDTNHFVNYTFVTTGLTFSQDGGAGETGSHTGNIFVLLRDLENSGTSSYEVVNRVSEKIGNVPEAEKFSISGRHTFGIPVSISILGSDLDELNEAKTMLMNGMKKIGALSYVTDNNALGKREVQLKLKPQAYYLGLNQASLTSIVRQGFFGNQAQQLQDGKDEIRVWVRYPKTDRMNLGQMENMKIKTPMGEYPLSELASFEIKRGPASIKHYNGVREIRINSDLIDYRTPVPPIIEKIEKEIIPGIKEKYPDISFEYQGQDKESAEATAQMGKYFFVAFLIILIIIMINFKSFSQAFIIIMMIPLAWIGAVWGHGFETLRPAVDLPVSILSAYGMIALSGVIINDAVVFLSKYNSLLKEGLKVKEAVYQAGIARFRPIVLTTITTSVGLYPIILEKSFQAQFLVPMAATLAYGVLIGTMFILLFFPVLILMLNDIKVWMKWLWTGVKPTREEVEKAVIYMNRSIE